jgi:hypothetical protein
MNAGSVMKTITVVLLVLAAPAWPKDEWSDVDRVVAVGDVHGDFEQFTRVLRLAGIINDQNKWSGGKAHLVQTGDVVDRGADSRKVMDLLIALESEARKAGGYVHALIGNHEAMNIYGDLRYVSAGEYEAFRNSRSEEMRANFYKEHQEEVRSRSPKGQTPTFDDAYRKEWEAKHPLGFFEHRFEFGPNGKYGKWIRRHNAVIRINDSIFLHGGLSPKYAALPISKINDAVRGELSDFTKLEGGMAMDPDGPLWFRGLAQGDENALAEHVTAVLEKLRAKRIVVGHTVSRQGVASRFQGRVVLTDIGLSKAYGAQTGCLVIEKGQPRMMDATGNLRDIPAAGPAAPSGEPEDKKADGGAIPGGRRAA